MTQNDTQKLIYLDYAATTPVDKRVATKMVDFLTFEGNFGNSASRSHAFGWQAEQAIEQARADVANLVNCDQRAIVWTSGATEANNLALKGAAHFYKKRGKHIISSKIEHKAVLDTLQQLEREGFEVSLVEPDKDGIIQPEAVMEHVRNDTILASFMHVNNEIGTITDIHKLGTLLKEKGIIFHVDAAQSPGKIDIDLEKMPVDLMSFSAHKIYGPKGIGALFVRRKPRIRLESQIHGGGHERGMRSGTLPTHQIIGMGQAFKIAKQQMQKDNAQIAKLRDRLWHGVKDMEQVFLNGNATNRIAGILNISFNFVEGESLIMALADLAVSSGSACTSASLEGSYVLQALGLNAEMAHSSIRFSIGRHTTKNDIDHSIKIIKQAVLKLRELSPLWDMHKAGVDLEKVDWLEH